MVLLWLVAVLFVVVDVFALAISAATNVVLLVVLVVLDEIAR